MQYLNVELNGLSGAPHPCILNIFTTQDVRKLRLHLKFLTGDFLSNERLNLDQSHHSPACQLCHAPVESTEHILVVCKAMQELRTRLMPDLMNTVAEVQPTCMLLQSHPPQAAILTKFLLDCSSLNLPDSFRVPAHNPAISAIFKVSRKWTFSVSYARSRLLKALKE